jgi:DNA repair exonuclease SbcCD ATPase subunit
MASGVPDSPFPVEKLLKMLDGLQALPVASRKAAVLALDSADDNWSIADVILDAQRKTRALREEQARLDSHLSATDAQAQADIASAEAYLEQATATIREQIAELETMLQQEVQQVATQKAEITHTLQSSRDAAARQRARLDNEIARIAKIPLTFGNIES